MSEYVNSNELIKRYNHCINRFIFIAKDIALELEREKELTRLLEDELMRIKSCSMDDEIIGICERGLNAIKNYR